MTTPAPFCDTCGQFMDRKFSNVPIIQARPTGNGLVPEAIWNSDSYQCPICERGTTLTRSLESREGMESFPRCLLGALSEQRVRIQGADPDTDCRVILATIDKGSG